MKIAVQFQFVNPMESLMAQNMPEIASKEASHAGLALSRVCLPVLRSIGAAPWPNPVSTQQCRQGWISTTTQYTPAGSWRGLNTFANTS